MAEVFLIFAVIFLTMLFLVGGCRRYILGLLGEALAAGAAGRPL